MAQDVSADGLPDDYTEFSSASESFEARAWAYDAYEGGETDDAIEIVDDAYFEGAFDDATHEPPRVDPFVTFGSILERAARRVGGEAANPTLLRALLGIAEAGAAAFDALPESAVNALVEGGVLERGERGERDERDERDERRERDEHEERARGRCLVRTARFASLVDAWSGILRGESEDFGPCGTQSLDEWAADLVARFLGSTSRAMRVRREVRSLGVAAFGLVASAA